MTSSNVNIFEIVEQAELAGKVILPADAGYDVARTVMYGGIDARPAVIVKVANAADVVKVVGIARDDDIELAIRSGGHSAAGHSTSRGGIVIDVRDMNAIEIDSANRTAWVGSGATAGAVTAEAEKQKLAVPFGDTGSVGVGGITLGGGVGYLVRKHGLTIDSLLAVEVVTADGQVVIADKDNHPDLFWALRGGGGNFGVATRFKFQLRELSDFTGGLLVLPATVETISGFIKAAEAAPEELSTICNVMPAPPMPFLPAEVHGKLIIFGMIAYSGDAASAEKAIAPFRALATPLADMVKAQPYMGMYPPEDDSYHPTAVSQTMFMNQVDANVAQDIIDYLNASDASLRVAQLRVLGGAASRVPSDATAYAHRSSPIMVNVAAFYDGEKDKPVKRAWVSEFAGALNQGDDGTYVNFIDSPSTKATESAYPGQTLTRLRSVKAKYDPSNLFRLNQNITPAAA